MRRLISALLGLLVCLSVQASNYIQRSGLLYDPATGYLVGYIGITDGQERLFTSTLGLTAAQIPQTGWVGSTTVDDALTAAYANQYVWQDTTGQIKYTADSGAKTITTTIQGRLLATQFIAAGTSTFTVSASTKYIDLELQCAGASGAGAGSNAANNGTVGAGGGAGGWLKAGHVAVTASSTYNVTLPSGGSAASGNGNAPASDCTVTIGATTYTAKAGVPGNTRATASTVGAATSGGPTAVSTNGDVNGAGMAGKMGMLFAANGAGGYSGEGGSSPWGAGGAQVNSTSDGGACAGIGSGGGGALSGSGGAAKNGAAGCPSGLYIREYSGT